MKKREIEILLDKFEFNISNRGYIYWIDMIELRRQYVDMAIGDLIKKVAKKHNATASSVERALRTIYQNKIIKIRKYFKVNYNITNRVLLELFVREVGR